MKRQLGFLALGAFVACVVVANYAVTHWGDAPAFPGGPYTVTILGLTAPSAVLLVGLSFSLRDAAQQLTSKWWVTAAIVVGALLSWFVASGALALASGLGFLISELFDLAVYTPLAERRRWFAALIASNTVGSAVDSFIFLTIGFGWAGLDFFWGQFWLKLLMTVPAVIVLAPWRLRAQVLARDASPSLAP